MFESGIMVSQEFILAALDLAHESNISRVVVPQWNSFGIFKPVRILIKKSIIKKIVIYIPLRTQNSASENR